jgi:hypothetical protein
MKSYKISKIGSEDQDKFFEVIKTSIPNPIFSLDFLKGIFDEMEQYHMYHME